MKRDNPRVVRLLALIAIVGAAVFPGAVFADINTACRFIGPVTVDGQNVPPGTVVTAGLAGTALLWTTTTFTRDGASQYVIDIPEDDPTTSGKDGAVAGDTVNFRVTLGGSTILGPSSPWQRTGFIYHPLRLTGGVVCILGDANGDGDVTMADVIKVERIIIGLDDPTCGADCNGDGVIDMGDIICIERKILGLGS